MIDELLGEAGTKMDHAVEHVQGEFGTIRTGRANPGILHRVMVDYYGSSTPLQELASFSVPEARLFFYRGDERKHGPALQLVPVRGGRLLIEDISAGSYQIVYALNR